MALTKEDIVKILDDSKIKYEIVEHKPVYTIDEMLECNLPHPEQILVFRICDTVYYNPASLERTVPVCRPCVASPRISLKKHLHISSLTTII